MPTCTCRPKIRFDARDQLHVLDDLQVALVGVDVLHAPVGERMRGAGDEQQAVLLRERRSSARRRLTMSARASSMLRQTPVPTSITDWCISALTVSFELPLALRDDLGVDVRAQIERVRIDRLVFLFDPDA